MELDLGTDTDYIITDERSPLDIKAQAYYEFRRHRDPISLDLARVMVRVLPPEETDVPAEYDVNNNDVEIVAE